MKTYKVWINVEEYDDEADSYDDVFYEEAGEFDNREAAEKFADALMAKAEKKMGGRRDATD